MRSTSPEKVRDAGRLGAEGALLSSDPRAMKNHANSFDFILSTVPQSHDLNP